MEGVRRDQGQELDRRKPASLEHLRAHGTPRNHVGPSAVVTPSISGTNMYERTAVLPGVSICDKFGIHWVEPFTNAASVEREDVLEAFITKLSHAP